MDVAVNVVLVEVGPIWVTLLRVLERGGAEHIYYWIKLYDAGYVEYFGRIEGMHLLVCTCFGKWIL